VFDQALVTFRGHHIELGTQQTEAWFRAKLSNWARSDQVRLESGNGPAVRRTTPRQPDAGIDFSVYEDPPR
jgi:hypothetical protein